MSASAEDWKRLCREVQTVGFENASPMARLVWSCDTGQGVSQQAVGDLYLLMDELTRMVKYLELMRSMVEPFAALPDGEIDPDMRGLCRILLDKFDIALGRKEAE